MRHIPANNVFHWRFEGARKRDREALALREKGLTYREMAEAMGTSPPRARQLYHRGRRLRQRDPDLFAGTATDVEYAPWEPWLEPRDAPNVRP